MYDFPHRRFNPLTGDWILVSPHRAKRPWKGQLEKVDSENQPRYDPTCALCPGNERVSGVRNSAYTGTFVFDNDIPALLPNSNKIPPDKNKLFQAVEEYGNCRVVCFSPRHDLTVPELDVELVHKIVSTWSHEVIELYAQPGIVYVQVFENKGSIMGCSNPHPHSQIWSQSIIPNEIIKELRTQQEYYIEYKRPLLIDYLLAERTREERIVLINDHFTALIPFWAAWPFEALIVAHRPVPNLPSLTTAERMSLADIYHHLTIKYDNLFETSFPYSMGLHQSPNDGMTHPEWVLHAHFYPPLLRSANIRKYMVGYEMLAMPQRDITPEFAAGQLRASSLVHYRQQAH